MQRVWVIMVERLHPECQCYRSVSAQDVPERCLIINGPIGLLWPASGSPVQTGLPGKIAVTVLNCSHAHQHKYAADRYHHSNHLNCFTSPADLSSFNGTKEPPCPSGRVLRTTKKLGTTPREVGQPFAQNLVC